MASRAKCIENFCKGCSYDQQAPGSWRQQVEECTVFECALWEVRPVSTDTTNLNRMRRPETQSEDA